MRKAQRVDSPDDATAPICVRQPGDDVGAPAGENLLRVQVEDAVVVCFTMLGEGFAHADRPRGRLPSARTRPCESRCGMIARRNGLSVCRRRSLRCHGRCSRPMRRQRRGRGRVDVSTPFLISSRKYGCRRCHTASVRAVGFARKSAPPEYGLTLVTMKCGRRSRASTDARESPPRVLRLRLLHPPSPQKLPFSRPRTVARRSDQEATTGVPWLSARAPPVAVGSEPSSTG